MCVCVRMYVCELAHLVVSGYDCRRDPTSLGSRCFCTFALHSGTGNEQRQLALPYLHLPVYWFLHLQRAYALPGAEPCVGAYLCSVRCPVPSSESEAAISVVVVALQACASRRRAAHG